MLWGDHDFIMGEFGQGAKHSNFEIDTQAPFIVSMPGLKGQGKTTKALVELVDVYPTLYELAGLP